MMNNDYWNLFAQSGSIDAYLAYKNLNKFTDNNDEKDKKHVLEDGKDKGNNAALV